MLLSSFSPFIQSSIQVGKQRFPRWLSFPTSVIAIRIVPQRNAQNLISQVIVGSLKLTLALTIMDVLYASSVFCDRLLHLHYKAYDGKSQGLSPVPVVYMTYAITFSFPS